MIAAPLIKAMFPAGRDARLSILIFHRVVPRPDPLFPDEIDAERFDRVCSWLSRWFRVLPLDRAVDALRAGTLPDRTVAITFDDGYADNHDIALPILKRHGLNATFFVSTGFLDGGRMWNDTVIEAVRHCRHEMLDLDGLPDGWSLGQFALGDNQTRRQAIDAVIGQIKYCEPPQRLALADTVAERAGVTPPDNLMMTSAQVLALRRAGMLIGAHTVSHPILARLDDQSARAEILEGKQALERLLGESVTLFAYPNGRPDEDYDARILDFTRSLGFEAAFSTSWGASAVGKADLFQLPRFTPWDRSAWRFVLRLWRNTSAPVRHATRSAAH